MLIRCLKCKKIVKNRQMCDLGPDSPAEHRTQSSPVHGVRQMFRNRTCPVYGVRQTFRNQTCPVYGVRQMFRDRTCPVSGIRQIFKHRTCPVSGVRQDFEAGHVRRPVSGKNFMSGRPLVCPSNSAEKSVIQISLFFTGRGTWISPYCNKGWTIQVPRPVCI